MLKKFVHDERELLKFRLRFELITISVHELFRAMLKKGFVRTVINVNADANIKNIFKFTFMYVL